MCELDLFQTKCKWDTYRDEQVVISTMVQAPVSPCSQPVSGKPGFEQRAPGSRSAQCSGFYTR